MLRWEANLETNVRSISGNWSRGFALDKHMRSSTFLGYDEHGHPRFDNTRTEVGEAIYQLKYRGDWSRVEPLATQIVESIIPKLGSVGLIVPVPASTVRTRQPVYEIASSVAKRIGVNAFDNIVSVNSTKGASLKNLSTKEEKVEALKGRFQLSDAIPSNGRWNVLVIDDLFHTGASVEAVCAILATYSKIDKIYVAALTWK